LIFGFWFYISLYKWVFKCDNIPGRFYIKVKG